MDEPENGGRDHAREDGPCCCAPLRVVCPICQALPGEPCVPASLTAPHAARIELAREAGR
jgi:hypothetical protein